MKTFLPIRLSMLTMLLFAQVAWGQVPKLNSYPSAAATVFLDFDGHYLAGTSWNWNGPINALHSGFNATQIEEIFNRVAEDYRPFSINITTDSTVFFKAPVKQRTRVIITPTSAWYGNAGGAAFVGSFTWGDDTPCFVFCNLLGYSTKKVGEASSHEAGHTLGLQHQSTFNASCAKTAEYNPGRGTGEISWAPIMGDSYSRNLTTWTRGTSTYGCSFIQDDIQTITSNTNKIVFRPDDHADHISTATPLALNGNLFGTSGILTRFDDRDLFRLNLIEGGQVNLQAVPHSVSSSHSGANLDIKMSLINATGDTISHYNPANTVTAALDTFLAAGTYYVAIDGVGNSYLSDTSSIGFYNIAGSYTPAGILSISKIVLQGTTQSGKHLLQWQMSADEKIKSIQIERSFDGKNYQSIAAASPEIKGSELVAIPGGSAVFHYRLAVTGSTGKTYYSNTLVMRTSLADQTGKLQQISNGHFRLVAPAGTQYQLVSATGQTLQTGRITEGVLEINLPNSGVWYLRVQQSLRNETHKLIKQ
jgi:hypothetical protein